MGDFFNSVPDNVDAYFIKSIIHDWDDKKSNKILENCRRAMKKGNCLLLVEQILPDQLNVSPRDQSLARSDLTMFVAWAAGERTQGEFHNLLNSAGFKITNIFPAGYTFSIIEAFPI